MTALIDFPQRHFELWSYSPSFNQLLLRSHINQPTRVDVLFMNVSLISLPADFTGLTMELASPEQAHVISQSSGVRVSQLKLMKLFLLRGEGYEGYVEASGYGVDESTRFYNEPSIWEAPMPQEWHASLFAEGLTHIQPSPDYWLDLGQRYGTWVHHILLSTSTLYQYPGEPLNDFIAGLKAGYAQTQLRKEMD